MEKIKLNIIGLSYSQTQSGAYALILNEDEGKRRLPIIIGGFEAQAIAIELEDMKPSRPLTHDLFKDVMDGYEIVISEVLIYNLVEGVFFAKIICEQNGKSIEIDSRTSDAIAMAVRFDCPIYTYEFILSSAGIILDESGEIASEQNDELNIELEETKTPTSLSEFSTKKLKTLLEEAIAQEDYEKASKIRDEINKRS